ncbi:MAG: VCBS repeat-containing protein [Saprospiraceae bacterium]|nr:VCBS repeat-containing protein [Saprospiraceae bacterium]
MNILSVLIHTRLGIRASHFCKVFGLLVLVGLLACQGKETPAADAYFKLLESDKTGLTFSNTLTQDSALNVFNYMYFFNGGGVAAGDFNEDGWTDLYFTSNMGPNRLFLNRQNLRFEEVTEVAGIAGIPGWTTGASTVDINNDGLLDIYVSQVGDYKNINGANQLYVCQGIEDGIPRYEDQAAAYGLDLVGFGTQAAFFDYDLDGDLDMYQLNHSLHQNGTFGKRAVFGDHHPHAGDQLLRNDDGKFVPVNEEAGIYGTVIGYGLGIVTGDVNNDGWPDIYIGNDFHENDYLYINQQDGTFQEVLTEQVSHTSRFSMGVDMADINNDGHTDIISLDMLPDDPYILKSSLGEDGYNAFNFKLGHGYHPQFARNNLQLNNGDGTFSEIGMFAGVYASDWSWAPLFLDFDGDGYRDIFISNGIPRRMNDIDYINFKTGLTENEDDLSYVEKMPQIKLPNRFYRNTGKLQFDEAADHIQNNRPSYSNGAIYADLDQDGDLDIVVNNIADEPFLYENLLANKSEAPPMQFTVNLEGPAENRNAIGAQVRIYKGEEEIRFEHYPVRGYQSSLAPDQLYVSIGNLNAVDSAVLIWPDLSYEPLSFTSTDGSMSMQWKENLPKFQFVKEGAVKEGSYVFEDITAAVGLNYQHKENPFVDFNREGLMPHRVSTEGPALAVGDVNGDGLEDVFLGSSKRERSALYLQNSSGQFDLQTPEAIIQDSLLEDVDAVFLDIDQDEDLDLVIASGGNEYKLGNKALVQRAYLNDGKGKFERADLFPGALLTASCVIPMDIDGDGWVDLFFGARAVPWKYGLKPRSFLYRNKGDGTFEEVTTAVAPDLQEVGMVKNGAWADIDGDGDGDLILAVEWDAVQLFINDGGQLKRRPINGAKGWWNVVVPHDLDGDGDLDIIAGNFGKNSRLKPTVEEPLRCYVNDFDNNSQIEQVLTYYLKGKEIPFANYAELTKQMVSLKKRYLFAKDMAGASPEEIFGKDKLEESLLHEVNTLQSVYFENRGAGQEFIMHDLPNVAQFSTVNAVLPLGLEDAGLILAGNFLGANIEMGWYDANYGLLLQQAQDGTLSTSGLGNCQVKGQVRRVGRINIQGRDCFIFAKNDDQVQVLTLSSPSS